MGLYYVYVHKNKVNGKVYVGITCQTPSRRWRNGNGYVSNEHFYRSIQKYGWDSFEHIIIADSLSKQDACNMEKKLIADYQSNNQANGYNKSEGGEFPAFGHHHSEKTKRIMSEKRKGMKMSDEIKRKIGDKAKERLAAYNPKTGKIGKDCPKSNLVMQLTKDGESVGVFYGTHDACRKLNFSSPSKIGDVCRGKRKTAYGYLWKYIGGEASVII